MDIAKALMHDLETNSSMERYSTHFKEVKIPIEQWRVHYNTLRPHSSLIWIPPAPESLLQVDPMIMIN